jgi:WD40 repeat protein
LLDNWLQTHGKEKDREFLEAEKEQIEEARGSLLTLDSKEYNPEDKNFNYYREYCGKELAGFLGSPNLKHSGPVTCVAVSPDGTHLLSGSDDFTLKLWDRETGACLKTIPLLWVPFEIKAHPTKPGIFATANLNGTVTFFDFSAIIR